MLCAESETVVKVDNGYLLDPNSAFTIYPPTVGKYSLAPYPTDSTVRIQYGGVYMDYINCATQGDRG